MTPPRCPSDTGTRDKAEKTRKGQYEPTCAGVRDGGDAAGRGGKKSTTGLSRVARTIKKRASAQILVGSKLLEKRNKR